MQNHKELESERKRVWRKKEFPRKTRWDNYGRDWRNDQGAPSSTSLFSTSFSISFKARDIYKVFQYYGYVDEVVIPSKNDV